MSKPLWKGDISFGLVSIPVSIVPVEQKESLQFIKWHLELEKEARISEGFSIGG